jgi:hypothetical protein
MKKQSKIIDLSTLISDYYSNVKRILRIISVGLIVATPLLLISSARAASATMSLTPSSATVAIGDTFSVDIYEDSGTQDVNAAKANLTYNANVLDYVSVTSSSAFNVAAVTTGGGGTVTIDRGAFPAVTGNQLVATVYFRGKAGGTTNIDFASGSAVLANSGPTEVANHDILTSTSGGVYTVPSPPTPPTPPPTPSPSPTPSHSPTPSPSPSTKPKTSPAPSPSPKTTPTPAPSPSTPAKDTNAPTISNVQVTDIGTNSALVSWETSEPATSEVNYGITTKYELTNGNGLYVTTHKLSLSYNLLSADTDFHFQIKSVDAAGNTATSDDHTFATKAGTASLDVTVVDQKNKTLSGAKVTIGRVSSTTDKNGHATLRDLAVGKSSVKVDYKGNKTTQSVDVKVPGSTPQTATVTVKVSKNYAPVILVPTLGLLVLGAGAFFLSGGFGGSGKPPFMGSGGSEGPLVIGGSSSSAPPPPKDITIPSTPVTNNTANKQAPEPKKEEKPNTKTEPKIEAKESPEPTIIRPTIPPRT